MRGWLVWVVGFWVFFFLFNFKKTPVILQLFGNTSRPEKKFSQPHPTGRQGPPRRSTRKQPVQRPQTEAAAGWEGVARTEEGGQQETHWREGQAERAGRVSRVPLGGARPPGGQGFSPRPLSACETPFVRSHRRSVCALPDQSHYSHVARRPGAVTLTRKWATAGKRSGEGAGSPQPPLAAHAAGSSVATATAWPPPLAGPSSRGRPADCLCRPRLGEPPAPRARRGALSPSRSRASAGAAEPGRGPGPGGRTARPRRQSAGRLWRAGPPRWQARAGRSRALPSCRFPVPAWCLLSFHEGPRTSSERLLPRERGRPREAASFPWGRRPAEHKSQLHWRSGQGDQQGPQGGQELPRGFRNRRGPVIAVARREDQQS